MTNIRPGYEGNFNKYDFEFVSPMDVPYDYESVMHYSGTGFVIDTNGTSIDPKIPYFSKVIGQRKDFSRNDVAKINRMYKCAGPLLDSFSCDFTEHNIGGFVNQPIDDPELAAKENVGTASSATCCNNKYFSGLTGSNMMSRLDPLSEIQAPID